MSCDVMPGGAHALEIGPAWPDRHVIVRRAMVLADRRAGEVGVADQCRAAGGVKRNVRGEPVARAPGLLEPLEA